MNLSFLLAVTFFASIDTASATPAQTSIDAAMARCEAANPESAVVALQDGKRVIVFPVPNMAVEVRASKKSSGAAAANVVAGLASRMAEKKSTVKAA